ncbi:unnamed protein product, partial [Acanthoscelides obtectus]
MWLHRGSEEAPCTSVKYYWTNARLSPIGSNSVARANIENSDTGIEKLRYIPLPRGLSSGGALRQGGIYYTDCVKKGKQKPNSVIKYNIKTVIKKHLTIKTNTILQITVKQQNIYHAVILKKYH